MRNEKYPCSHGNRRKLKRDSNYSLQLKQELNGYVVKPFYAVAAQRKNWRKYSNE